MTGPGPVRKRYGDRSPTSRIEAPTLTPVVARIRGVRVVAAAEGTATESATADWEEEDRVAELNEELMPDEPRLRTS